LPTALHYKICSQKQFLDSPQQYNQRNRTTIGPNTRIEAIREVERDILDSLKRLTKFTTDMSGKKLQAMPYDVFTRKQAALPQFKRLCTRTIRVTRDGQQLAPRLTKHDFYYKLFEEFVDLLDMQNDLLLEIEESMEHFKALHESRKQQTDELKSVKTRPPTPYVHRSLQDIFRTVDLTLTDSSRRSTTLPAKSPSSSSGYSSSSSSFSESTTTTTATITTTVRHNWSDSDDSSTCSDNF
jgi:hypothetical protein